MSLNEKVAIITGASRGVGKAIALKFAEHGLKIAVGAKTVKSSAKTPGSIFDTVKEVEARGSEALAVKTDVRSEEDVRDLVRQTVDKFGRIDVIVNNAGAILWQPVGELPIKRFDLMIAINYRAPYLLCHEALPFLKKQETGHIINMSPPTQSGHLATEDWQGRVAYLMSKFGMTHLTFGLAAELRQHNIAVNSLWPAGIIDTQATRVFASMFQVDEKTKWYAPEMYADACLEIIQSDPNELTGEALVVEELLRKRGVADLGKYEVDSPVDTK